MLDCLVLTPIDVIRSYPAHDYTLCGLLASRRQRAGLLIHPATSYDAFQREIDRAAAMLLARGIARGKRVAVMARNSTEFVLLFFALARIGAIMVPVNPDFGAREAGYILAHARVAALAASEAAMPAVRMAIAGMPDPPWLMSMDGGDRAVPAFTDLVRTAVGQVPRAAARADDTCLILYTSGTTGFPKGVMHSQRNFVLAGEAFVARMWLQPEDRLLCILPLFHINALFYSLAGTLAAGASLALVQKFSASTFWQTVYDTGATQANIIAAIGNILARRPRSEFVPGHSLRVVYGAPVTPELERTFREEFHVPMLIEGYGMSEIPGAANNPYDGEKRPHSFGLPARHPDPAVSFSEMRVVDDEGRDLPDGRTGELWVRTPILMQGYYKDPEQTTAAMHDGWFATGDLVRRDSDGYFYFVARKKDIIRRRGENISGAEIDRVVGDHPAVVQCAAIPVPSELGEDEILVAIVRKPEVEVSAGDIARWCRERLAAIKQPRYVVFVESLPMTATQRVQKFQLRADETLLEHAVDLERR
ncbi:MAG: AMP-binding protein [Betaproteobacteria bacterium]|nr:AMP-binding protein [Betaproteobacteria bacterium]